MLRNLLTVCALLTPIAVVACGNGGSTTGAGGSTSSSSKAATSATTGTTTGTGGKASSSSTAGTGGKAGTGGAAGTACLDTADGAILNAANSMVESQVGTCGTTDFGMEPGTVNCIKMATGLSQACSQCFADTVSCAVANCITPCLADSAGACCAICRSMHCDAAFETCSGIKVGAPPPAPDGGC